jgi:hypothetical protein
MSNQNSIHVGDRLGPFEYTLTEEMADIYLAAIDNSEPRFRNLPSKGHRLVPPCFTVRDYVYLLLQKKAWGIGGIHTKQESEFFNPAYVGQRLVCRGKVAEEYYKKARKYTVIEYQIDDSDGKPIAKHRFTGMVFQKKGHKDAKA